MVSTIWKISQIISPGKGKYKKMKPQPTEYSSVFWHGIITPLLPEPIPFICDSKVNVDLETQQMDSGRNATQIENDESVK